MNGYQASAENYRKHGDEKKAKVYDFLSACDQDDINTLFDSGAFNYIALGYVKMAVIQLDSEGVELDQNGLEIRKRVAELFDAVQASEVWA